MPPIRPGPTPTADPRAPVPATTGAPIQLPRPGTVRTGTSGFGYPGWAPRFYPTGLHDRDRLPAYAARLGACELNNTFYRRPSLARLEAWRDATPDGFRFVVKAQRGAAIRVMRGDPAGPIAWLTEPLPGLGDRLGAVLFRVPAEFGRDDAKLDALLAVWPPALPLVVEFRHHSWLVDETFARLRAAQAVLCATESDEDAEPPTLRVTGPFIYVRLRRVDPERHDVAAWAARLAPFVAAGLDAYVFVRHDATGGAPLLAAALAEAVDRRLEAERAPIP